MKTTIKNIANIRTGVFAKPVSKGDLVYIQPKYFNEHGKLMTKLEPDLNSVGISDKHILHKGDILFASKGTRNFATCFLTPETPAAASTSFFVIHLLEQSVLPQYLNWYLNQHSTLQILKAKARGTSMVSIPKSALGDLPIFVPTIEKQKLIIRIAELRALEKDLTEQIEALKEVKIQQQIFDTLK